MGAQGVISVETLRQLITAGEIDTVMSAVCDMQGRLVGKRVTASHFAEHVIDSGTHFCTYLLATDMELITPDGFASMTWDSGYGDYLARADWSTLRIIPWLEKTALVLADVAVESTGAAVPVAPRTILRRQVERLQQRGLRPMMATELEFYLFNDSYEEAHRKGYANLERSGWYSEDYQLFQSTKSESLYRQFRNQMTLAGVPVEFSKGEAAPGQHEVNITYSDALEAADRAALFKHGAKEMAWQHGQAITFMAKPDQRWTGSSGHIHVSLWDDDGAENLFRQDDACQVGKTAAAGDPSFVGMMGAVGVMSSDVGMMSRDEMSDLMRWFLGGMIATARDFSLFVASNINSYKRYSAASWAPVNAVWARDNRTCGFRVVGHGKGLRIENRIPGGDSNPYLAFAAVLAGGLHGIEHQIEPPGEFKGNAYVATGVTRVPSSLGEAIETWQQSAIARDAFGDLVVDHYLNAARVEQDAFNRTVTDWERMRYFERG